MGIRFISTRTHGVIDYLSVPVLLAAPRAVGWSPAVRRFLTGAAAGTLAYSLLTRYELGARPLLPMPAHLALDGLNGAATMAAPWLLGERGRATTLALLGLGAFEVLVALTTETRPAAIPVDDTAGLDDLSDLPPAARPAAAAG